jgi:lipoprotein-anchoring transpeptidase ErfK/SrfK
MKSIISSPWVRSFNVIFLTTFLILGAFNTGSHEVTAQPKSQRISQTVKTLKKSSRRWIQVDISQQKLVAWEGKNPVYAMRVSTGKTKTPTRTGIFNVQTKLRRTKMQGKDYNVPNVPNVMYYSGGYGIHGAYWHNNFGTPVSHGCVNLRPNQAKRLYNWASVGTPVIVQR